MDLMAALQIRQLGYTVRFSTLLDASLQETAEDTLMKSDFSSKICDFKNPTKSVFILSTSPDGRHVASGHGDHSIYISEVATGKVTHCLTGHRRTPWTVVYHSHRNDLLASGCLAGEVRVWDLKTGCSECLRTEDNTAIASVAFHPSEQYLAVATADKVLLWDWNQSYPFAVLQTATARERLRYVRFDPTGYILFTGITNQRETLEPTRFIVTPPEIMPSRFREMLTSRNELLQMRAELSRSHQRMLQRYNELQTRYNRLREQYPDLVGASTRRWDSGDNSAAASSTIDRPSAAASHDFRLSASPPSSSWLHPPPRPVPPASQLSLNGNNSVVGEYVARQGAHYALTGAGPGAERLPPFLRQVAVVETAASSAANNEEFYDGGGGAHVRNITVAPPTNYIRALRTDWSPYIRQDSSDERSIRRAVDTYHAASENVPHALSDDEPSSSETATASSDLSQPPLSPIALEGLQDAVAYAREITTRSMDQFVRRHHDSIARLQQSYRQISEQAQNLMQNFSQTLDDMQKLQEMIDKKYPTSCVDDDDDEHTSTYRAVSSCSNNGSDSGGQRCIAVALLSALSRMRKVLEKPSNEPDLPVMLRSARLYGGAFSLEHEHRMQMENEANRLLKVHEIIREFDNTIPMNSTTRVYLNHHRIVLNDIARDITNASDNQTLTFIRARLTEEIKEFQNFIQRWKQDIMIKMRNSSSNGFRSIAVTKSDAQAQTSPLTLENNSDDQPGPSTSGYSQTVPIRIDSDSTIINQQHVNVSVTPKRPVSDDTVSTKNAACSSGSNSSGSLSRDADNNSSLNCPDVKRRKVCSCSDRNCSCQVAVMPTNEMETEPFAESVLQPNTASIIASDEFQQSDVRDITINLRRVDDDVDLEQARNVSLASNATVAPPSGEAPRSHVSISSAVEMAVRRRHRLFGASTTRRTPVTSPSITDDVTAATAAEPELRVWRVRHYHHHHHDTDGGSTESRAAAAGVGGDMMQNLPELTVRRVRQAAERLNDVERRVVAAGLPETTVQRVRQAAERLSELERRADVLTAQVSTLSARRAAIAEGVAYNAELLTQRDLLQRREARLSYRPVRALRDLSVENLASREFAALRQLIDDAADASQRVISGNASTPPDADSGGANAETFRPDFVPSTQLSTPEDSNSPIIANAGDNGEQQRTPQQQRVSQLPTRYQNVNNVPWHRRRYGPPPFLNTGNNAGADDSSANATDSPPPHAWTLGRPNLPDFEQPTRRRAYVILNRTVNAPMPPVAWEDMEAEDRVSSFDLHRSVNRAIAGAFIGTGDVAVANNILDTTCRIQFWNIKRNQPPDISQSSANVILGRCKLNNDGSVSISEDGRLLAAFVENDREDKSLWAHTVLKIVSLRPEDRGVVLYQKTFAPNAISVSISPAMGHVLIGLASRRYLRLRHSPQTFAQVYRLCDCKDNSDKLRELKLTMNIEHRSVEMPLEDIFAVRNESLNCAIWLKTPGHGICYGTNKGQLLVLSGKENVVQRRSGERDKSSDELDRPTASGMRVLLRRNGRLNMADSRQDDSNTYRTVVV